MRKDIDKIIKSIEMSARSRPPKEDKLYLAKFEDGEVWIKAPSLISAAKCLEDNINLLSVLGKPEYDDLLSITLEERPTAEIEALATGPNYGFYNRIYHSTYLN